jgi:uncharacterized cupredoxin-like copper-binding protein
MHRKRWMLFPGIAVMLLGAACGGGTPSAPATPRAESPSVAGPRTAGGTAVSVTEKDFSIAVDPSSAAEGSVNFSIDNQGPSTHEFVVFKTDLEPDALPTDNDGNVDEEGEGVEHIDEQEDIASGSTALLDVTLEPGSYVLICNLPGHYKAGMHVGFTVS